MPVADDVGYVLLAKGDGSAGARWRYRVVCRDGAFVRHGIELTSPFLFNLPWHSVVEVGLLYHGRCFVTCVGIFSCACTRASIHMAVICFLAGPRSADVRYV